MKRILSILLAVTLMAALAVPAMAYDDPNEPAVKFIPGEFLETDSYLYAEYTANHAYAFVGPTGRVLSYDAVDYDNKSHGEGQLMLLEGTYDEDVVSSNGPFYENGNDVAIHAVLWTELDRWLIDNCATFLPVTYTNPFTGETKTVDTDMTTTEAPAEKPVDTSVVDSTASGWAKQELAEAIEADFVPENLQGEYKTGVTRWEMALMVVDLIETASGKYFGQFVGEYMYGTDPDHELIACNFTDVDYSKYDAEDVENVVGLYNLGIINGTKTIKVETSDQIGQRWDKLVTMNFAPESTLTRAQIAAILQRTGKVLGLTNTQPNGFKDVKAKWMKPGVDFVYANGIMKGVGGNRFAPDSTLTREQAIITTLRFYKALSK